MSQISKLQEMMSSATEASSERANSGVTQAVVGTIEEVALGKIYVNPSQHRKYFDPDEQQKLQNSIQENGFQGAVLLRILSPEQQKKLGGNVDYELVYGESRLRAIRELGWESIPAITKELTDRQVHRLRLDENLVRKDLNPLEEMDGLLEVIADELETDTSKILIMLDRIDNERKKGGELTGDVASNAEQIQEVLDYYKKGSVSGFRTKYRKLQVLPDDIREAVSASLDWSKAVEIKPIKDEAERKKVLQWAIAENPSVKEIREYRAELRRKKAQSSNVTILKGSSALKKKFYQGIAGINKSAAWDSPEQQERIQKIMAELEDIFSTQF